MRIDLWSDLVCPFCWIGKRHLEEALARTDLIDHVEWVHRAFELDPRAGRSRSVHEYLAQRYGGGLANARALTERTARMGREAGLEFDFDRAITANTFDAHRLVQSAQVAGHADVVLERLMGAHFAEGADLADHATLRRLAQETGMDDALIDDVLSSDRYADVVRADEAEARRIGVRGVPFFVLDGRFAVSGAQPVEAFVTALQRARSEAG